MGMMSMLGTQCILARYGLLQTWSKKSHASNLHCRKSIWPLFWIRGWLDDWRVVSCPGSKPGYFFNLHDPHIPFFWQNLSTSFRYFHNTLTLYRRPAFKSRGSQLKVLIPSTYNFYSSSCAAGVKKHTWICRLCLVGVLTAAFFSSATNYVKSG